jgi:hypothetical protein
VIDMSIFKRNCGKKINVDFIDTDNDSEFKLIDTCDLGIFVKDFTNSNKHPSSNIKFIPYTAIAVLEFVEDDEDG